MSIEAIQARRDARRQAVADAHAIQFERDLQRLDELEEKHGFERVLRIDLPAWDPGIGGPTLIVVRVPKASEALMKAFEADLNASKEGSPKRLSARNTLARACIVYPHPTDEKEAFDAVMETASGILAQAALQVVQRAQGIAEQEGKD